MSYLRQYADIYDQPRLLIHRLLATSLPLNGPERFGSDVEDIVVDAADFVHDAATFLFEDFVGERAQSAVMPSFECAARTAPV
jgi:hypothetical protein